MNIDQLRDELELLAGPPVPPSVEARAAVRRRVRRRRTRSIAGLTGTAVVVGVLAFVGVGASSSDRAPVKVKTAAPGAACASGPAPVAPEFVPPDVAAWAHGDAVVGQGAVWTIRSAIDVAPHPQSGQWYLKFPWFLRPPGIPTITGRRLDGEGTFRADANLAYDASGTWTVSGLTFSAPGCWEVTARYRGAALTVTIGFAR
jgi:hypothetical protein